MLSVKDFHLHLTVDIPKWVPCDQGMARCQAMDGGKEQRL